MKNVIILAALLFALPSFAMTKVQLTGQLYIPAGFDDNDLVEVVVNGSLPDLCHKSPGHEVIKDGNNFIIKMYAYRAQNAKDCQKLSLPYNETVRLGILPEGHYKVSVQGVTKSPRGRFEVRRAVSPLQDDFLYGNVQGLKEYDYSREIELIGTNPVNCLKFLEVIEDIQKDVIVLKPRFKQEGVCEEIPTPFVIKYKVPFLSSHPKGVLLHIRVLNGRSYNYLYQNRL